MGKKDSQRTPVNMPEYEKKDLERIQHTFLDLNQKIEQIILMIDFCNKNGVVVKPRPFFDYLGGASIDLSTVDNDLKIARDVILDSVYEQVGEEGVEKMKRELGFNFDTENKSRTELSSKQYRGYNG